jgi:hypothetical protein
VQERRALQLGPIIVDALKLIRASVPATIAIATNFGVRCPLRQASR